MLNNLTGKRFGKLVVIKRGEDYISPKGQKARMWICNCDCGTENYLVRQTNLMNGSSQSCGCNNKLRLQSYNKKPLLNNKSGVTGVYWYKNKKLWRACIGYENVLYHLGWFTNKEDAIRARKEAELKYFGEYKCRNKM